MGSASGLRKISQPPDLFSTKSEGGENPGFLLLLGCGQLCEPGIHELSRAETRLDFAVKPALEIRLFIEIPLSAKPELPGLHIARRNAEGHAVHVPVLQTCLVHRVSDLLVAPLKAFNVRIDDHQQPHRLTRVVQKKAGRVRQASQNERKSALLSTWLDTDADTTIPLENGAKQSLVLVVFTEQ